MPVENTETLPKWHMTSTPPEIDKYGTHKNGALRKWHTFPENAQRLFAND